VSAPPIILPDEQPAPAIVIRTQEKYVRRKSFSLRLASLLLQILLGGVIGLAAGGFVLYLMNPENVLVKEIVSLFHP